MLGDLKDQRSFVMWASLWLGECWRLARAGASCLVFSDWRQLPALTDAIQAAGWAWKGIIVWHKPNARPSLGSFRHDVHVLAPELTVETTLDDADAARAEAERLLVLHGASRLRLKLPVKREYARGLDLGSVVAVRLPRFGLVNGRLFGVIGMAEEYETGRVTLEVVG